MFNSQQMTSTRSGEEDPMGQSKRMRLPSDTSPDFTKVKINQFKTNAFGK